MRSKGRRSGSPSGWRDYVEAGCDGFVVNLGHDALELEDRVRCFGAEVAPLYLNSSRRKAFRNGVESSSP